MKKIYRTKLRKLGSLLLSIVMIALSLPAVGYGTVQEAEASGQIQAEKRTLMEGQAGPESIREASVYHKRISGITSSSRFTRNGLYTAQTPNVVNFWDGNGNFSVASYTGAVLTIQRYREDFSLDSTITLSNPYTLFGTVTGDSDGYYYVLWGQSDVEKEDKIVTCLAKYDYAGKLIDTCEISGFDSNPYIAWEMEGESTGGKWGTRYPFWSGNCALSVSNHILTCSYARLMYSGHQSNFIFYVDCENMERLYSEKNVPYCSHSFDQDAMVTTDGSFLYANHGDAFKRGFLISKVNGEGDEIAGKLSFHFREGQNREYGYNETYAQLGGLAETSNSYILCAASERTLSRDVAPTTAYCGHNEAADLFIQILKKDFGNYSGKEMYYTQGETRTAVGSPPDDAITPLYLSGEEEDYGVIWLTELEDSQYVCNPKILSMEEGKFVVLWEELSYENFTGDSYYKVLDENGNVLVDKTKISGTYLMGNTDLAYHKGSVYWTTNDENGMYLHQLDVSEHNYRLETVKKATWEEDGLKQYVCEDCGEVWENGPSLTIPALGKAKGDVNGDGEIDAKDALAVLKYDVGIQQDVFVKEAADVNEDDVVDAKDALIILKHDVGILKIDMSEPAALK